MSISRSAHAPIGLFVLAAILCVCLKGLTGCSTITRAIPALAPTPTATLAPSPTPTCKELSASYVAAIQAIAAEWDDANNIANNTSRVALSGPVAQLQTLRRKAATFSPPGCAELAQIYMIQYMDSTIEGYLAFMRQAPESTTSQKMTEARNYLDEWKAELQVMNAQ